jgi:hypothetical protein
MKKIELGGKIEVGWNYYLKKPKKNNNLKYRIEFWRQMILEIILKYAFECLGERSPGVPFHLNKWLSLTMVLSNLRKYI